MTSLEKFIEETNAAESANEVFKLFEEALAALGYDRFCYSLITDHPSLGLEAGHGVMRNYPEDWMKHYVEKGYEKTDPVPQYCFVTSRPFTWDWVVKTEDLNAAQKQVMDEAEEAKLLDGVAIPMYGLNGEIAGVGMASSLGGIKPDKNLLCIIRAISYQFHLAYTEKEAQAQEIKDVKLTDREREILLWAAEGKSDQTIADLIGISHGTVRFHLNNVYKKLDANERIYAVTKALRHGLILPSYVSAVPNKLVR